MSKRVPLIKEVEEELTKEQLKDLKEIDQKIETGKDTGSKKLNFKKYEK